MSIPEGYIVGLVRDSGATNSRSGHLYKGTFDDPGLPMCSLGWNRGSHYSIWRGQSGKGVCKICLRRAEAGLPPVEAPND
jgi:hypothetical protein